MSKSYRLNLLAAALLIAASINLPSAAAPVIDACQIFPANHIFNTRIDSLPVHPASAAYLQTINSGSRRLHLDLGQSEDMQSAEYYGIPYNVVSGSTLTWQPVYYTDGWPDESDCAKAGHSVAQPCVNTGSQPLLPIPASPLVEGGIETNQANYGDHHILVIDRNQCMLWESYHSYPHSGGGWDVLSSAAFDLNSNALRPQGWTSADAAGFPILPLLLRAGEAGSGEIRHALRFTIQSSKIRAAYVWPATHLTSNGGSSSAKPAMGQLFRLKSSYVIPASYTVQAKAILTAMQRYGMYIADGGSDMYVQGEPSAQWSSSTISQVQTVAHTEFEAVDLSPIMTRAGFNVNSAAVPSTETAPVCTLTASPGAITAGGGATLTASCTPAATSYAWTNAGFASTAGGGTVTPSVTTTYTVTGSNAGGNGNAASATVTVSGALRGMQALFVNASTSTNKTSVVRVINTTGSAGSLIATAFDQSGVLLGTANASLGSIAANQTLTFSSATLESLLGFVPAAATAKYSVYFYSGLSAFQIINTTQDRATGTKTLSQAQYGDRSSTAATGSSSRSAWFLSASTSANKTNVLWLINTSTQSGSLTATLYDETGVQQGAANTSLGSIAARQMLAYTSAQLESAFGYVPPVSTFKYRVVFTATVPSVELINFTKDIATGNLALVQPRLEDRPAASAAASPRHVLLVNPSTSAERNTVLRLVNPNTSSAAMTATAYDESGAMVGSGSLGSVAANAILALTSAQIESALGYAPSSVNAKYRLVVSANVPTFEVIDNTKLPSNGNLYLAQAQAQTDNRAASTASAATRHAHIIYPSNNSSTTTELRLINTTAQNASLSATAYDDSGALIATGKAMGTLAANQMLTFTSAQLESLISHAPSSSTAKWRIVFSANLSNFELLNYSKEVAGGLLTLAQPQTE